MELNRLRAHEIVREKTNLHLSLSLSLFSILPFNNAKIVNRNESSINICWSKKIKKLPSNEIKSNLTT